MKLNFSLPNLGILTAFASSLCCIMPVLAIVAGTSGLASTFSWLEPARPFFIGATVLVLGFAWYQQLKPKPIDDCGCHIEQKTPFMQTKAFLSGITIVSALLLSFPSYAHVFFPKSESQTVVNTSAAVEKVEFKIDGMTCESCEHHVASEVTKLTGIFGATISYPNGNAVITYDKNQTNLDSITTAINSTGYTVTKTTIQ
ncbi:MAG: mercuric transport protein MerTP [Saprospiraceae bacterium]|nr:mercuric transport protein MerTP [Saprospiraceae bacterium]